MALRQSIKREMMTKNRKRKIQRNNQNTVKENARKREENLRREKKCNVNELPQTDRKLTWNFCTRKKIRELRRSVCMVADDIAWSKGKHDFSELFLAHTHKHTTKFTFIHSLIYQEIRVVVACKDTKSSQEIWQGHNVVPNRGGGCHVSFACFVPQANNEFYSRLVSWWMEISMQTKDEIQKIPNREKKNSKNVL